MTIGGWLTIRYRPSTSSPSFDSACRLSRVRAFALAFSALFSAFLAALVCCFACFLAFFGPFFASSAVSARAPWTALMSSSSSRWAYEQVP